MINGQNDCWWSEHEPGNCSVYTDWRIGDEKNLCQDGAQESHTATVGCAIERSFDIQMHYGDAAASLLIWSRTLRLIFISKSKIGSKRTPIWVNRRHPEGCNTGLKWHSTSCIPEMLQTMAAPLEKVCAGKRVLLWRWPHCSWWISFFFFEPVPLLYCQTSQKVRVLILDLEVHHVSFFPSLRQKLISIIWLFYPIFLFPVCYKGFKHISTLPKCHKNVLKLVWFAQSYTLPWWQKIPPTCLFPFWNLSKLSGASHLNRNLSIRIQITHTHTHRYQTFLWFTLNIKLPTAAGWLVQWNSERSNRITGKYSINIKNQDNYSAPKIRW